MLSVCAGPEVLSLTYVDADRQTAQLKKAGALAANHKPGLNVVGVSRPRA